MSRLPYRNRTLCRAAGRQPWLSPRRTCKKIQIVTIVFSSYSPKAKAGALRPPERFLAFKYLKPIILRGLQLCPDSLVPAGLHRWFSAPVQTCIYNGCINLERRSTKHAEECKRTLERRAQRR